MSAPVPGAQPGAARAAGVPAAQPRIDAAMLMLIAAIVLLGLVMVTSASISIAARDGGEPFAFLERQLLLVLLGCGGAALLYTVPIATLERLALPLLVVAGLLLLLVFVPGLGHAVKGSRRWLRLAGLNFQASEAARVLVLIWVASYAVRCEDALRSRFGGLAWPLGVLVLAGVLLLAEPDFGAACVLFLTGFGVLFLAGAQLRWVVAMALGAGGTMVLLVLSAPYRMRRITGFIDPWRDPFDSGFQLTQSLIAIGRGEWFGVGLGASVQKLLYLPEAHTDFLFAVLAEELGLAGVALTLGLFLALCWRVFALARRAHATGMKFHAYLAAGFGLWLGLQSLINIGVNMGVLPTKGLTLPLMSYGRSSLIVALVWCGMILRVHHEVAGPVRGARTRERRS
ncbi:MAG: putative lipid II flippase FtsW [Gammaproteobacteria bacterium]|nr:putative lipid II flippase FtsW [Gammaproteobacteria bacterium]